MKNSLNRRREYDLRIPTEKQLKEMRAYANKVVKRMMKRREGEKRLKSA